MYGIYLGGSEMNSDFELSAHRNYNFSTQRRNPKSISHIEGPLIDARSSTTALKFNGQLEAAEASADELDKERFIQELRDKVRYHGQQFFFTFCRDTGLDSNGNSPSWWRPSGLPRSED